MKNKRLFVIGVILVIVAVFFWTQSRYPALNDKALMGESIHVAESLSFDYVYLVSDEFPILKRIVYTTINWANTNKKGMTFGVIFASVFLTFLSLIPRKRGKSVFLNTLKGLFIGSPLGVCANCVAPIGKGMYTSGMNLETVLAAMISSPTLNVVVLTMLFTLFPFYFAFAKVFLTLTLILIVIPVLSKYVFSNEANKNIKEDCCEIIEEESWIETIKVSMSQLLKNFLFIFVRTVPLMLLAGILGAVVVEFIPLEYFSNLQITLFSIFTIAFIGVFLPVPIAFDIVVVYGLMQAGLSPAFAMVLLFTLGIYSIYPFMILWETVSLRLALTLFFSILFTGVASGYIIQAYDTNKKDSLFRSYHEYLVTQKDISHENINNFNSPKPRDYNTDLFYKDDVLTVEKSSYMSKTKGEESFDKSELFFPMPSLRYGIASGDINNDGWQDFVVSDNLGVHIYINSETELFQEVALLKHGVNTALVDINNDGWQDVYFSYFDGNYFALNDKNNFKNPKYIFIPSDSLAYSASFADIDRDGDLDVYFGNWSLMLSNTNPNKLYLNDNLTFTEKAIEEIPNVTLSTIFSDFDNNGSLDLIVANDFQSQDLYFLGNNKYLSLDKDHTVIPELFASSMSVDVADINNDLVPEIFITAMSFGDGETQEGYCDVSMNSNKDVCKKFFAIYKSSLNSDFSKCLKIDESLRSYCFSYLITQVSKTTHNIDSCNIIQDKFYKMLCINLTEQEAAFTQVSNTHGTNHSGNILLMHNSTGFVEKSKNFGLDSTFWSWNGKFADLDNDGWQDLYVGNGTLRNKELHSNVFLKNNKGEGFTKEHKNFGLEDFSHTKSFTYLDIDNDGDLDIITTGVAAPVKVYTNNENLNNSIIFDFKDYKANFFGVGNKIYIYYGENMKKHQMRELKIGGGFMSYDAPVLHFGLGQYDLVKKLEIHWSTGEISVLEQDFPANNKYSIHRASL